MLAPGKPAQGSYAPWRCPPGLQNTLPLVICVTWVLHVCCCPAVRAVLAERGDDPALAAATAEQLAAELAAGEGSKLKSVMQVCSSQRVMGRL